MIDAVGVVAELRRACPASEVAADVPLGARTTYRVGGAAAVLAVVDDVADLVGLARVTAASGAPTLVLGRGSNLLVADAGFPGVAVLLGEGFDHDRIDGTTAVAGAGRALPVLARTTVAAGLTGFEWAVGVPGSVGGAVRMNAGGHGSDMSETLVKVTTVDLETAGLTIRKVADLDLSYRHSSLRQAEVVVDATLELATGDRDASEALLGDIVRWRRENQPGGQNAGSVFVNPPGSSAGRLIDAAGCKGLRMGTAEVSTKHANFILADPDGSADDILALMGEVRRRVEATSGITLAVETHLVGFEETS